ELGTGTRGDGSGPPREPQSRTIEANPSNRPKPQTSVSVVTNTEDATAGSTPNRSSSTGTKDPAKPATNRLRDIARKTTPPSRQDSPSRTDTAASTAPIAMPLTRPTTSSLPTS